jgi:hypothetical protein
MEVLLRISGLVSLLWRWIVPRNSVEGVLLNAFKAAQHRSSDWGLVRGRCLGDEERGTGNAARRNMGGHGDIAVQAPNSEVEGTDGRVVWANVAVRTTTK